MQYQQKNQILHFMLCANHNLMPSTLAFSLSAYIFVTKHARLSETLRWFRSEPQKQSWTTKQWSTGQELLKPRFAFSSKVENRSKSKLPASSRRIFSSLQQDQLFILFLNCFYFFKRRNVYLSVSDSPVFFQDESNSITCCFAACTENAVMYNVVGWNGNEKFI